MEPLMIEEFPMPVDTEQQRMYVVDSDDQLLTAELPQEVAPPDKMLSCSMGNWSSSLLSCLRMLQLQGQLCDVTLVGSVDGGGWQQDQQLEPILAHSSVLSASSSHLREVLTQQLQASNEVTLEFPNIPYHLLKPTVDFLYTGDLSIPNVYLRDLLELSEQLSIEGLTEVCNEWLNPRKDVTSVPEPVASPPQCETPAAEASKEDAEDADEAEGEGSADLLSDFLANISGDNTDDAVCAEPVSPQPPAPLPAIASPARNTRAQRRLQLDTDSKVKDTKVKDPKVKDSKVKGTTVKGAGLKVVTFKDPGSPKTAAIPKLAATVDEVQINVKKEVPDAVEDASLGDHGSSPHGNKHGGPGILGSHVCPCGAKFSVWCNLQRHRAHCQENRRFVCPVDECAMKFRRREYVKDHLVAVHSMATSEAKLKAKKAASVHVDSEESARKRARRPENYLPACARPRTRRQAKTEEGQNDGESVDVKREPTDADDPALTAEDQEKPTRGRGGRFKQTKSRKQPEDSDQDSEIKTERVKQSTDSALVCPVCGQVFKFVKSLRLHEHKHKGTYPYMCKVCGRGYMDGDSYKNHVRNHSGKQMLILCELCGRGCTTRGGLAKHIKVMHKGIVQFKCKECGKEYRHRSSYDVHKRSHREGNRKHCPSCDKVFLDASGLKRHLRTHSGERPYKCRHCSSGFSQGESRKKHELICSYRPDGGRAAAALLNPRPRRQRRSRQVDSFNSKSNVISIIKQEPEETQVLLCEPEKAADGTVSYKEIQLSDLDIDGQACFTQDGQNYVIQVIEGEVGNEEHVTAVQHLLPEGATMELEECPVDYQHIKEEVTLVQSADGDVTWQMVDISNMP